MRRLNRIVSCVLAGWVLTMMSGCTIELGGLKEVARSIDGMREQLDKTTKEGGDLDRLLATARKDVEDLIKQAEAAGGRLEEKVVLDLIEQRKALFLEATELMKKTDLTFKASALAVTADVNGAMQRLPKDIADQIGPLVLAIPGLLSSTDPIQIEGTEITFRPKGYYRLSFDARQAANLDVRVDGKAIFSPRNRLGTRVSVEIPASSLLARFRDQDREFIRIELVDRKDPTIVRFLGSLDLRPLFGVEYHLTEYGPNGQERAGVIEQGAAIQDILEGVSASMKSQGADAVKIAERHGQIYGMARERLPYGSSYVDLPPGFNDFDLTVTLENGAKRTLDRNQPHFGGIRIHTSEKSNTDGKSFWRATIVAEPPTER